MPVTEIKTLDEFNKIINGDKPAVIDFWATWCGPCRVISPIFESLSKDITDIEFYKVDVDVAQDVAQEVGIRAMPTFALFHKGNKVGELVGAAPQKLNDLLQQGVVLAKA